MSDHYKYKIMPVEDLMPYENNSRTHSEEQIDQVVASIKEFNFTNPILIDEQNGIVAGHGRLMAANKLGMREVPCIVMSGLTEAQKKAYIIADNQLALNAGWDLDMLKLEIEALDDLEFDIDLLGFDNDFMDLINDEDGDIGDIEDMSEFNEKINFIVECDDLVELSQVQHKLGVQGKKIKAAKLLII